jgi:hypothetical protein
MRTPSPRWLLPLGALLGACWSLDYSVELKHRRTTTLLVGDTVRLTAEVYADGPGFPLGPGHERVYTSQERPNRFRWASSDSLVLWVDSEGLVIGRSPGQAMVTATVGQVVSRGAMFVVEP